MDEAAMPARDFFNVSRNCSAISVWIIMRSVDIQICPDWVNGGQRRSGNTSFEELVREYLLNLHEQHSQNFGLNLHSERLQLFTGPRPSQDLRLEGLRRCFCHPIPSNKASSFDHKCEQSSSNTSASGEIEVLDRRVFYHSRDNLRSL